MKKILITLVVTIAGIMFLRVENVPAADITLELTPEVIEIGAFYNGTTVNVRGQIPVASEAVIRLSGKNEDLHLKRKGKVGGLLWMNVGDLTFHHAPKVYKLLTSTGIGDLDNSAAKNFGFTALKNRIEITPDNGEKEFLLKEFVRLKKKESLYSITPDSISYASAGDGMKFFKGSIAIPPGMTQGTYMVEVEAIQNGVIVCTSSRPLPLKQVGFPDQLTAMAFGHSVWYGVVSVIIAVMAGLAMGIMFKDKGGSH